MLTTPAAAGTAPRRAFFPCFDGYRAMAAMTVLLTHASFITTGNHVRVLGPYLARLDVGVAFFFLISGFLLYRPFAAAVMERRPGPAVGRYFRRRAVRILPAYWLALTVALFVFRTQPHLRLGDALFFYGFAQIYDTHHIVAGLVPAWSLDVEVTFYLFLPVWAAGMAWLARRRDPLRVQLAGVAGLYAASVAWRLWVLTPGWGFHVGPFHVAGGIALNWLPAMLDYFALGMLLAVLHAGRVRVPDRPWVWWVLGAAAFWTVAYHVGLPVDMRPYTYAATLWRQALYGLAALAVLVPGVFGDQKRGLSRALLRDRRVVWLGTVSYGIYLWHEQWIAQVEHWTGWAPFSGHFGPLLLAVTVLSVAAASASYVIVERPLLRLK